ncbi:MAG: sensor histidine kinase [Marmoricola sp.]
MTLRVRGATEPTVVRRLVLTVAVAMLAVLVVASAFVYWRMSFALTRQLDRDLDAYRELTESAIRGGEPLVSDTPGLSYQTYSPDGKVVGGDHEDRLIDRATVRQVAAHGTRRGQIGHLLRDSPDSYRYVAFREASPRGEVVVACAISREPRDEALRELLLQLALAGLATLAAASFVGYRTARGALKPVERYRRAAAQAGEDVRLPVPPGDDEISRLGHTFNDLLDRISHGAARERQFLADASHELRAPLTVMRTEVEWARLQARDPAGREALDSLHAQVERLVALCNALLSLEEVRALPAEQGATVRLADVAGAVESLWGGRFAAEERALRVEVPEELEVVGDAHWLAIALGNLVSNALRYGDGTTRIAASRDGASRPGGAAPATAVWVEDEGPGFPPGFVERAFDRFARAEESRSSGGTGLGLAIVAAIAENHHGSATIEGSRVTLRLPAPVASAR